MRVYIRFIVSNFLRSFLFVTIIFLSLVILLNLLTEIEFFKNIEVKYFFPLYIALLNAPSLLFEMFPFIFLISTQFFFINIFNDNQIQIFKYSGLKNSKILFIICSCSFVISLILITFFYSFSSSLKTIYLEIKNKYTTDDKYLAVITNNGLWIKDTVNEQSYIVHASKINNEFLIDTFVSQFDKNFNVIRHIQSNKVNIKDNNWKIFDAIIVQNGINEKKELLEINLNFNYEKIQSLFSNLASLSLVELFKLKNNYRSLNYSTTDVKIQINKILSYPIYLLLMTFLSSIIMFSTKDLKNNTFKISIGFFLSVLIYYMNNFFMVMGKTEKISITMSIWMPLLILFFANLIFSQKINEK